MPTPNQPLAREEVVSPQLIEPENPNETTPRNPGDPTISLDPDGTVAGEPAALSGTTPTNPTPDPYQSDPAHVPSPYQPPESSGLLEQKETARLREEALQAENRFRPNVPGGTWQPGDPGRRPPLHEMADQPVYDTAPDLRGEEPKHENHRKHKKD